MKRARMLYAGIGLIIIGTLLVGYGGHVRGLDVTPVNFTCVPYTTAIKNIELYPPGGMGGDPNCPGLYSGYYSPSSTPSEPSCPPICVTTSTTTFISVSGGSTATLTTNSAGATQTVTSTSSTMTATSTMTTASQTTTPNIPMMTSTNTTTADVTTSTAVVATTVSGTTTAVTSTYSSGTGTSGISRSELLGLVLYLPGSILSYMALTKKAKPTG